MANSCMFNFCGPGDKGITYASTDEPYSACATRELVEYTAAVAGMAEIGSSPNGKSKKAAALPTPRTNVGGSIDSSKTRRSLDKLMSAAKVKTLQDAMDHCTPGLSNIEVTVVDSPTQSAAILVQNDITKAVFWMPKELLNRR
jgi:hypothetical protein